MITNERQARTFIQSKRDAGIIYTLERMEALMEALDHPERKIRAIHIAGTNGKGSTCAFISSIYKHAGYSVGAFNTPVFGEEKDQITIDLKPMSSNDFVLVCQQLEQVIMKVEKERNEKISEFECMVAIAYYFFAVIHPVDVVLVEAGMGGRLDATNVLRSPIATVITNVGKDHQRFLGETISEIAQEKAGIIKRSIPHFTACKGEALQRMKERAAENNTDVFSLYERVIFTTEKISDVQVFTYQTEGEEQAKYKVRLLGEHQSANASLALSVVNQLTDLFYVTEEDKQSGLQKAFVPGRWEVIMKNPRIILDTAHNEEAIDVVCDLIEKKYADNNVTILFAAMKDKPVEAMVEKLSLSKVALYFTSLNSPRGMALRDYQDNNWMISEVKWVKDARQWIGDWQEKAKEDDLLVITGSHYFVGACRADFLKTNRGQL